MALLEKNFMEIALRLARRGVGNVAPNPSVGCIIVNNNIIVGRGWTQKGGRPHAEIVALKYAGDLANGATMYVTLEPCCHYGKTKPCVLELINSRIKKVVIASYDPDERVCGQGIEMLKKSGIEVFTNVMTEEAREVNIGFFFSKERKRPFVAVKVATSLDGKIALTNGQSKWITNSLTRSWVHKQRFMYDAIMIGSNTLLKDDPKLTCRLPGLEECSPVRIIIDKCGKIDPNCQISKTAGVVKTYILTRCAPKFKINNIHYLIIDDDDTTFLKTAMTRLAEIGITRVLVEGGGTLITEMLRQNLVDRLIWCRSEKIFGNDAIAAVKDLHVLNMQDCCKFKRTKTLHFDNDIVEILDYKYSIL